MRWGRRLVAALLLLLGVALLFGGQAIGAGPKVPTTIRTEAAAHATAGAGSSRTVTSSGTPAPRPPAASAEGHATQASGRPVSIQLPAIGFSSATPAMSVDPEGVINPPDFFRTFWISDRGGAPNAHAQDTTYFACHSNSKKSIEDVPCNRLSGNVRPGDTITVNLEKGSLAYKVTDARQVRRAEFASQDDIWGVHPGRLVWVTCYIQEGLRTDFNYVVIAELEP